MKNENGLAILARRDALTEQDWITLVESRLTIITPYLRSMSLKPIGDIGIIHDYFGTHNLRCDNPTVDGGKFDLTTRGIFPNDDTWTGVASTEYHRGKSGSATAANHKLWGFTRDGVWITIEVTSVFRREPYKHPGRTEEVQKVKTVKIRASNLTEICIFCKRSPQHIFDRLGEVIKKWTEQCKDRYELAKHLEEEVLREEVLLKLIPLK